MTGSDETMDRAELLAHLRNGVRKSRQLALRLSMNPETHPEAQLLLDRLQLVAAELEAMQTAWPEVRQISDNAMWRGSRQLRH